MFKSQWPAILEAAGEHVGKGAPALLAGASPASLESDTLVIEFDSSASASKSIFERGNRLSKLQQLISEMAGRPVVVKLSVGAKEEKAEEVKEVKSSSKLREELMSDPSVKLVLGSFNASVTKIEEN